MYHVRRYIQCGLQRFNMLIVLVQWVLKFKGLFEDLLCPLFLMFFTKNPTLHILCFDNEYAETRNKDMVNLGCAVQGGEGDIMKGMVDLGREEEFCRKPDQGFPEHSFEPGRTQEAEEEHKWDEPPKCFQNLTDDW